MVRDNATFLLELFPLSLYTNIIGSVHAHIIVVLASIILSPYVNFFVLKPS